MPAPGAGGVQTSLVGTVQSMMASARNAFRRKPGPTPGAPIQSPGGNPPDLTQFSETFEPSGGLFAPGYPTGEDAIAKGWVCPQIRSTRHKKQPGRAVWILT